MSWPFQPGKKLGCSCNYLGSPISAAARAPLSESLLHQPPGKPRVCSIYDSVEKVRRHCRDLPCCRGEPDPAQPPPCNLERDLIRFWWSLCACLGWMILFHLVSAASWACESKHMLHPFHAAGEQGHGLAFPSLFPFMSSFIPSIFLQHQVLIRLSRNTTGFLSHRRLFLTFLSSPCLTNCGS